MKFYCIYLKTKCQPTEAGAQYSVWFKDDLGLCLGDTKVCHHIENEVDVTRHTFM